MKLSKQGASFRSETPQDFRTGSVGNVSAASVGNNSTSQLLKSNHKAGIVMLLPWLLAWRPALTVYLGKLVLRLWPGFRGA